MIQNFHSILPPNSTEFERALEYALRYNLSVDSLSGFKFHDIGSIIAALIYEFDLGQVNIDDLRRRILEGFDFHRRQGTVFSLRQALSWYGINNVIIEEEPPGEHFAEFQLGFEEIPSGLQIETIINVAEWAKPLRSRLKRMYNPDYDLRRFILDQSPWGDILDDDSGIFFRDTDTKISFGRRLFADASYNEYSSQYFHVGCKFIFVRDTDSFILDFSFLDDALLDGRPTRHNHFYALRSTRNHDYIGDFMAQGQVIRPDTFSRAMIVLDENAELDGAQCCFGCSYDNVEPDYFELDFSALDNGVCRVNHVIADVRLYNSRSADAVYDYSNVHVTTPMYSGNAVFMGDLLDTARVTPFSDNGVSMTATYNGNDTWHDHRHFNLPWNEQNWHSQMLD